MNCGIKRFPLSRIGICRYLKYGFVTEEHPLVEGINQVAPGTIVIVDLANLSITESIFWKLEDFRDLRSTGESDRYRLELSEIGNGIFQGEVPIGIALSGGIDSSLIASIAKRLEKKVKVISIGYDSKRKFDESSIAESYSKTLGFECRIRNISAQEVGKRFPELVQAMDEPIADPSSFSYFVLAEEARKLGLKVLLSGHGPDELFWGYPWISNLYSSTALRMKMYTTGASLREYLNKPKFQFKSPGAFIDELKTGFGVITQLQHFYEDSRSNFNREYSIPVYSRAPGFRKKNRNGRRLGLDLTLGEDALESIKESEIAHGQEIVREILIKSYLRVNGLSQIDRLWMANSIEGRSLLVDYKLVESALSDSYNTPNAEPLKKTRFKDHISDFLSVEKLNQPKQGFTPPVRAWYLEIYRQNKELISNSMLVNDGQLSKRAQGYMRRPLTLLGRPRPLWLELVTLELWYRKNYNRTCPSDENVTNHFCTF
jgi:asparagine synthase (glutamine-hydrolysing)